MVKSKSEGDILIEVSDAVRQTLIADMDSTELLAAAEQLETDEIADIAPDSVQWYRSRAEAAGLDLDDGQLADLCQAMPHLEAMIAHLPTGRAYDLPPSTTFNWQR